MKYLIGTRGSQLSIAQTKWIISELQKQNPEDSFEIITITTKGDTDARPLFTIDQKGIFEKEVDRAVSEKRVHFAVHSLKDVPTEISADLTIACIPKREKVNDILISKNGDTLESLPTGALIGTSSLRRAVQISRKRPDIKVKPIRGNIETRVRKVTEGEFDGVILAIAGITRLGLDTKYSMLTTDDLSPSPGQGALAIVCRKDDSQTISMLKKIEDNTSRWEIEAERALSKYVDSGCRFPIGAYAKSYGESMTLKVSAFSVDGQKSIVVQKSGPRDEPESLGRTVGKELQEKGIADLALNWREKVEEWNKQ
ncbi:MAG: hydroxymethylbilane synthase [Crenarchaeota archaeon]|nr:MAG: hydroxymethylbilane synthase [Thermoproteota archaeon]RDJ33720.1 MAG: hydroxymethylbilane synthase [Thermoproteota archaeon]RDJ37300.1 MAG: hydroxymethylbilane synthase [Thermoproteota archaeon]RDJ39254.1 MAG: hydroxymethylbilane synthase [Thermoproteota archaeon]